MDMKILAFLLLLSTFGCTQNRTKEMSATFDLQGHRGCRGLMPENTIPAFLKAIELGVNTLEMDLAVTADGRLVVSHEPFMSSRICLDSSGAEIPEAEELSYNIYKMTYEEVSQFDCGSRPHPWFPAQQKLAVVKPLLTDVLDTIKAYEQAQGLEPLRYNIEIKSSAATDHVYHPAPGDFSDLVYQVVDARLDWELVTVQSFDFRILQYFHKAYPHVRLALLIENDLTPDQNLDSLGFKPDIYSCDFTLLSRQSVLSLQQEAIKVVPWTVNEVADMQRLVQWGVDGLITDYPDRFKNVKNE